MLASKYRFHGHGSLKYVFKNGDTLRSKHFILRITPNSRRQEVRVAVVVSKKIFKAAVKRNRIRRRVYETIRPKLTDVSSAHDIAFIVVRPELLMLQASLLETEITDLLKKGIKSPKV